MVKSKEMIIEDGFIHVVSKEIEQTISVEDFVKKVASKKSYFSTKQLPVNCVKYEYTERFERYYIHIREDNYKFNYLGKLYVVRIPHTLFIFSFKPDSTRQVEQTKILWCDDVKLDVNSSNFFVPPLHNIYDDGNICTGVDVHKDSQDDYINDYLKNFFSTEFNNDLSSGKRTLDNVSKDQIAYNKRVTDQHLLVDLWWKTLIYNKEEDMYFKSKQVINLKRGGIDTWLKEKI